jgi:alpha-1,2-mannosyltransferase
MFGKAAQMGQTTEWPHLFSLASLAGIEIDGTWRTALRLAAALGTLALCWRVKSEIRNPKSQIPSLLTIYALATVYLLLFNPRTENNSYLLLSPVMALLCVRAYFVEGRTVRAALLLAGAIALFAGHEICQLLTPRSGFVWISPLVCVVVSIDLVGTAMLPPRELPPKRSSAVPGLPRPHGRSRNNEHVAAAGAEDRG